jgi:hypothetical protein
VNAALALAPRAGHFRRTRPPSDRVLKSASQATPRVVDGARASEFLLHVIDALERPG